jgi:chromosome segregation ATPase
VDETEVATGGVVALIAAALGLAKLRERRTRAERRVEQRMAETWQRDGLARVQRLEQEYTAQARQLSAIATENARLRWQLDDLEHEHQRALHQLARAESTIRELQADRDELARQNQALALELRSLYREIAGGHQTLKIRVPPQGGER